MSDSPITLRETPTPQDRESIREILESTGFFYPDEIETAMALLDERLARGVASGYHFLFADRDGRTVGYACFGPIACTRASYELFWIGVREDCRGQGIGKQLLRETETIIRGMGGGRVYIETSSRELYVPTRAFYLRAGYREEATLQEFYGPGDGKVIYVKAFGE
ncbi:MAG: GNAT family N-acetyltransferase [Candidatus Sumerlaeota bacterium]|nr:GNAT family N-acetyltransferase [Candidatus Sumerlaeota bacterium]